MSRKCPSAASSRAVTAASAARRRSTNSPNCAGSPWHPANGTIRSRHPEVIRIGGNEHTNGLGGLQQGGKFHERPQRKIRSGIVDPPLFHCRGGSRQRSARPVGPHGFRAKRRDAESRFHQPPHRPARRLRPDRRLCARPRAQGLGIRLPGRRQDIAGRDPRSGYPVRSVPRRPTGEGPDQQPGYRPDARRFHPGNHQSGGRCLRGGGHPLPLHRHALGSLVFRPRRQAWRTLAVQMDLSFRLRRRTSSSRPMSRSGT